MSDGEKLMRAARAYYEEWDARCLAVPPEGVRYTDWLGDRMAVERFCREMGRAMARRERRVT